MNLGKWEYEFFSAGMFDRRQCRSCIGLLTEHFKDQGKREVGLLSKAPLMAPILPKFTSIILFSYVLKALCTTNKNCASRSIDGKL